MVILHDANFLMAAKVSRQTFCQYIFGSQNGTKIVKGNNYLITWNFPDSIMEPNLSRNW